MSTRNVYRVLRVDLTANTISEEQLPEMLYREYIGGRNIIAHYLLNEVPPGIDPLSEENVLVFATGVLTGVPIGCCGRNSVGAKGPLTGGYAEAEAGGYFGAELRLAGYDAVVVSGCASEPVYLTIIDGRAELREARPLWGLTVGEAHEQIRHEIGEKYARTALIGPAGENQVRIACILNDVSHAYGRGGLGAVMGSKQLKGIAVRGHQRPEWSNPEIIKELGRWFNETWMTIPDAEYWSKYGTIGFLSALDAAGALPTRNFQAGRFEEAERISGEALTEQYLVGRGTCYACSVKCKREISAEEPYHIDRSYGGPEYETAAAFGSACGVSDLGAISKSNELCNAYGIDTISAGATIAWAMECYENGLLSQEDTDELELRFGNAHAVVQLVEDIALKRGFGAILGNGAAQAAELLGVGAEFAMHVKKQDFPMHEPRVKHGLGLSYAVSPTGADHMHAIHDSAYANSASPGFVRMKQMGIQEALPATELSPAKVRMATYEINQNTLYNCLVICNAARQPFRFDIRQIAQAIRAVTGWKISTWELMKIAERSVTLARVFNVREGFTAQDDRLPMRMFEGLQSSPNSVPFNRKELEKARSLYYEMMGWDAETGVPTQGGLIELDIDWAWDHIAPLALKQ